MKLHCSEDRTRAMTLFEVVIVLIILAILAFAVLPYLARPSMHSRYSCTNVLKQIVTASYVWAGDNDNKYPMAVSATNGGAMEAANVGDAARVFQVMSNELSTAKILWCPEDSDHSYATNWTSGFSAAHVSYFIGVDATLNDPQSVLAGDDNFQLGGNEIKSGLRLMSTNVFYTWNTNRHHSVGNLVFGDGSVQSFTKGGLTNQFFGTNFGVLRLAIP